MRMAFKKEESRTTSRRILTRFMLLAKEGKWINGTPPYGFAVNEETGRLVLGDAAHVKVVQWMFDSYAKRDVSIRWLALELHKRSVLSPTGKEWWSIPSIHKVLKNRNYLGIFHWNTSTVAEFNHLQGRSSSATRTGAGDGRRRRASGSWCPARIRLSSIRRRSTRSRRSSRGTRSGPRRRSRAGTSCCRA
jgi:hypothetical protein